MHFMCMHKVKVDDKIWKWHIDQLLASGKYTVKGGFNMLLIASGKVQQDGMIPWKQLDESSDSHTNTTYQYPQ